MEIAYTFSSEVADALASGQPIVALECVPSCVGDRDIASKIVRRSAQLLREAGVVPAPVAVLDGQLRIGLTEDEQQRLVLDTTVPRLTVAELPIVLARGGSGIPTLGATAFLSDHADIRFVATGCIGGINNSVSPPIVSSDIRQLSEMPVTVIAAGVAPDIDVDATWARYRELDVTIVGIANTSVDRSQRVLDWIVPDARAVAAIMESRDELELCGAVVVVPPRDPNDSVTEATEKSVMIAAELAMAWSTL